MLIMKISPCPHHLLLPYRNRFQWNCNSFTINKRCGKSSFLNLRAENFVQGCAFHADKSENESAVLSVFSFYCQWPFHIRVKIPLSLNTQSQNHGLRSASISELTKIIIGAAVETIKTGTFVHMARFSSLYAV